MHAFATFKSLLSRPSKSFQERKSCVWKTNMTPEPTKNPLYEFYYYMWHILTLWKYTNSLLPLARNVITKIIWGLFGGCPLFSGTAWKKQNLEDGFPKYIHTLLTYVKVEFMKFTMGIDPLSSSLSSEVGPPQLIEYKEIKKSTRLISFPEMVHLLKSELMISRGGPKFEV